MVDSNPCLFLTLLRLVELVFLVLLSHWEYYLCEHLGGIVVLKYLVREEVRVHVHLTSDHWCRAWHRLYRVG